MVRRLICTFGAVASLLAMPTVTAQFGVAGGRKRGATSFEALNEMAKEQQQQQGGGGGGAGGSLADFMAGGGGGGGGMPDMAEMHKLLNDPEMAQAMERAMEELSKMSPEQVQQQMQEALGMLTEPEMVDTILEKKDEVLQQLEASGLVSKEDIAKYKADPQAFEAEMRDAFGQMQKIFSDGEALKEAMASMVDPLMKQVSEMMQDVLMDDDKIEQVRLELLKKPEVLEGNPFLGVLFDSKEFKESLQDEQKWKDAVKKGQQMVMQQTQEAGVGQGAGVGEL